MFKPTNNISGDHNCILLFYVETNQTMCGDRKLVLLFVLKNTQTSLANGTKHRFPYLKIVNVFSRLWPEVRCDLAEKAEPNLWFISEHKSAGEHQPEPIIM